MEEYKSPVYNVIAVPVEKVVANTYNPNIVAPPEMKLLELSIFQINAYPMEFNLTNWNLLLQMSFF